MTFRDPGPVPEVLTLEELAEKYHEIPWFRMRLATLLMSSSLDAPALWNYQQVRADSVVHVELS